MLKKVIFLLISVVKLGFSSNSIISNTDSPFQFSIPINSDYTKQPSFFLPQESWIDATPTVVMPALSQGKFLSGISVQHMASVNSPQIPLFWSIIDLPDEWHLVSSKGQILPPSAFYQFKNINEIIFQTPALENSEEHSILSTKWTDTEIFKNLPKSYYTLPTNPITLTLQIQSNALLRTPFASTHIGMDRVKIYVLLYTPATCLPNLAPPNIFHFSTSNNKSISNYRPSFFKASVSLFTPLVIFSEDIIVNWLISEGNNPNPCTYSTGWTVESKKKIKNSSFNISSTLHYSANPAPENVKLLNPVSFQAKFLTKDKSHILGFSNIETYYIINSSQFFYWNDGSKNFSFKMTIPSKGQKNSQTQLFQILNIPAQNTFYVSLIPIADLSNNSEENDNQFTFTTQNDIQIRLGKNKKKYQSNELFSGIPVTVTVNSNASDALDKNPKYILRAMNETGELVSDALITLERELI